eukprot:CAMPEP_0177585306 /NCGR_PEP_ID=MMETSP0419_2-20121207/4410_1 /TAXON_ID=582737 /ORGANISM="Tetraselmis sp., Strain GSL018" /LENGTH=142 /DNA_ID=CAMNT_0019075005 /DNA_START=563 /DNA_END=992 /DNA_ORIENTATION=-
MAADVGGCECMGKTQQDGNWRPRGDGMGVVQGSAELASPPLRTVKGALPGELFSASSGRATYKRSARKARGKKLGKPGKRVAVPGPGLSAEELVLVLGEVRYQVVCRGLGLVVVEEPDPEGRQRADHLPAPTVSAAHLEELL